MPPRRQLRQSLEVRAEDSRGGQGQVGGLPGAGAEERNLKISRRIMNYLKALEQERRDNLKRAQQHQSILPCFNLHRRNNPHI